MIPILESRLAPFRHQGFRRFFFAQTLSLTGTWSADLARAWLVLQLMGSASALGMMLLATALPGLFLILHGGVLVDRVDVRRLMIWTKALLAVVSLALALSTEFFQVSFTWLLALGLIEGLISAFDSPAYQALLARLVPKADFQQGIALGSINFHASRMLGPLVAGLLLAVHGPALVFLFDALTYISLVVVLWGVKTNPRLKPPKETVSSWSALTEGLKYLWTDRSLRAKVLQLAITIILIYPLMMVVFRTYMQHKFGLTAEQFGFMFTLPALGSMCGALSFAMVKPREPIRALKVGVPGVAALACLVPLAPHPVLAAMAMALTGFFLYLTFASLTVSVQLEIQDEFRGRISAVIGMFFVCIGPLMGFPIGSLGDTLGFRETIWLMVTLFLGFSLILAILDRQVRQNASQAHVRH